MRRIQEVITDPLMTMSMALAEGSPELQSAAMDVQDAADEPLDGSTLPASMEQLVADVGDVPTTLPSVAASAGDAICLGVLSVAIDAAQLNDPAPETPG